MATPNRPITNDTRKSFNVSPQWRSHFTKPEPEAATCPKSEKKCPTEFQHALGSANAEKARNCEIPRRLVESIDLYRTFNPGRMNPGECAKLTTHPVALRNRWQIAIRITYM
jgi:hypothetical protein